MAENFINVSNLTYCGKEAEEIFVKNLYKSDLKAYGIRYMSGVKGKMKLMSGEVGDLFQAYTCPFTPEGDVILSEEFIEPVAIKVNLENCYSDFWNTYMVNQTEITLNGGIPQMFFDWFFNNVLIEKLGIEYEEIFWNGDTAYTGATKQYLKLADGIVKKIAENENSVKVQGAVLTTSNILGVIGEVAAAVDNLDIDVENYKIFVNYKDYRKLLTALGNESPTTIQVWSNFSRDNGKVFAYGYEVVPSRIAANTVLCAEPNHLVLGYDVADAETYYKLIDMRETTLDNTFRVGVLTSIAVGAIYPAFAVIAKP